MPPKTVTMRGFTKWPSATASSRIWTASSRVGATTSARGGSPACRRRGADRASRVKTEIRNAAVLPVPVCACAATSRPREEQRQRGGLDGRRPHEPAGGDAGADGVGERKVGEVDVREVVLERPRGGTHVASL